MVPPVEGETKLPSPYNLRHKIILKHKKLPEGQEESAMFVKNETSDIDIRSSVKNGIMYLEDPVDKDWEPHFFVLTQNKLFYTNSYRPDQGSDRSEDEEDSGSFQRPKSNVPNEELHFSEKWFHGRLPEGRKEAEQLLRAYSHLGILTFLWYLLKVIIPVKSGTKFGEDWRWVTEISKINFDIDIFFFSSELICGSKSTWNYLYINWFI